MSIYLCVSFKVESPAKRVQSGHKLKLTARLLHLDVQVIVVLASAAVLRL